MVFFSLLPLLPLYCERWRYSSGDFQNQFNDQPLIYLLIYSVSPHYSLLYSLQYSVHRAGCEARRRVGCTDQDE
jgi:hypothetical protein